MITFNKTKLHEGHLVDLRSVDEIARCKRAGTGCIIDHNGESMVLTLGELETKCVKVQRNVPSIRFKDQFYDLHSYEWDPTN